MHPRSFYFNFGTNERARIFVRRVALNLEDVAIFIEDASVYVIDGGDREQRTEIFRLALMSGGTEIVRTDLC